ncbi:hypothetical protein [Saccharopolyspora shandongensis]|uniref:hypothetical protein n=1 Tax=Saccharopolyspora shandongensis TaxID=418495 RepID=UPI00115F92E4|nr:hypothetical protein [Saccharopolyspora shandongensis]
MGPLALAGAGGPPLFDHRVQQRRDSALLVGRDDEVRRREHGVRREPTSALHRGRPRGGYIGGTTAFAHKMIPQRTSPAPGRLLLIPARPDAMHRRRQVQRRARR